MDRDRPNQWLGDFLRRRNLHRADGRPLWRYRMASEEFEEVQAFLLPWREPEDAQPVASQLLVLFAAELWRRQSGNGWTWQELMAVMDVPDLGTLERPIELGLHRWQRPLIRATEGRQHLHTLAFEGGVPAGWGVEDYPKLKAHVRPFLAGLGRTQKVVGLGQITTAGVSLQAESSQPIPPQGLTHWHLLELSAEIGREVHRLLAEAGPVENLVAALDGKQPDWRQRFPMESGALSEAFLEECLEEARTLSRERTQQFRIERWLRGSGDGLRMEACLELPSDLDRGWLAKQLKRDSEELPSRTRILLEEPNGRRSLVATASDVQAPDNSLRFETAAGATHIHFDGPRAQGSFALWLGEGSALSGPRELLGGHLPTALPWVFGPVDATNDETAWRLIGHGSVYSRDRVLRIAVANGWRVHIQEGRADVIGQLENRTVYQVVGSCRLSGPDGAAVLVRTGQPSARQPAFQLTGTRASFGARSVYLGRPTLWKCDELGRRGDPAARVEWRPVGWNGPWQRLDRGACLGQVWMRVAEREALSFLEPVEILPVDFKLALQPGPTRGVGQIVLQGLHGATVKVQEDDVESTIESSGNGAVISVQVTRKAPMSLTLFLNWDEGCHISLPVLLPARRAGFIGRAGEALPIDHQVPVDRLGGIQAVAATVHADERFVVHADLVRTDDAEEDEDLGYYLEHSEEIPGLDRGRHQFDIGHLQESFRRLLAASPELDAALHLRIESDRAGLPPYPIRVGRFEAPLLLDEDSGLVRVPDVENGRHCRIEAMPLWQPEAPRIVLERQGDGFQFAPKKRETGPWLLLGWDGDWCRFQPTLWHVGGEGEPVCEDALTDVQQGMRLADPVARYGAMGSAIRALIEEPHDPGWSQIMAYIGHQSQLPPGTFEALQWLAERPEAAAAALLRGGGRRLEIWTVLEDLPFAWRLVPLRTWRRAATRWHEAMGQHLAAAKVADASRIAAATIRQALRELALHRPFLRAITDWLASVVLGDELSQELQFPRMLYEGLLDGERQELIRRAEERWWPHSVAGFDDWLPRRELPPVLRQQIHRTRDTAGYTHATFQAPLLAAFASVLGIESVPRVFLYVADRLRDFDSRFFDKTYEFGLRLALSLAIEEDWESLS